MGRERCAFLGFRLVKVNSRMGGARRKGQGDPGSRSRALRFLAMELVPCPLSLEPYVYFTNKFAIHMMVPGQMTTMRSPTSMSRQKGKAPQ